jgi:phosphoribosyl 1,2-cyclic phosphodiesterase
MAGSAESFYFERMYLDICSLNSGSNGNCYYIGNDEDAVLIDAGISCRETEKRMGRAGLSMKKVRAIFISHEHGDHIAGLDVLSRKFSLPVYITQQTVRGVRFTADTISLNDFLPHQAISIGSLQVRAFPKFHDAADPYSFIISNAADVTVGVFTDLGRVCEELIRYFKQCNAAFLETNYDTDMLEKGGYPFHLKQRIRGGDGHLSNTEALDLFLKHRTPALQHLVLSHLSKNNNRPEIVEALFTQHAGGTKITVASRYKESLVYRVTGEPVSANQPVSMLSSSVTQQLSLF